MSHVEDARMLTWELLQLLENLRSLVADALEGLRDQDTDKANSRLEQGFEYASDFRKAYDLALENVRMADGRDSDGDPLPQRFASHQPRPWRPLTYPGEGGTGMRALTLHQPWAWAMAHGYKTIENRSWAPPEWLIGCDFALHAAKKYDKKGHAFLQKHLEPADLKRMPERKRLHSGCIVAVARLDAVVDDYEAAAARVGEHEARWFLGQQGWMLGHIRRLWRPVPCRGYQGLWTMDFDVERAIADQLC